MLFFLLNYLYFGFAEYFPIVSFNTFLCLLYFLNTNSI